MPEVRVVVAVAVGQVKHSWTVNRVVAVQVCEDDDGSAKGGAGEDPRNK